MRKVQGLGVRVEGLESRCLFSSIVQVDGIGYLPSDNGTTLQRYDVANQNWLTPVALENSPGGATASLVDADGIYVAYGRTVMRYKLDGSAPTHLLNAPDNVHAIHSDGKLLFLNHTAGLYARFVSIDKNTNTIMAVQPALLARCIFRPPVIGPLPRTLITESRSSIPSGTPPQSRRSPVY